MHIFKSIPPGYELKQIKSMEQRKKRFHIQLNDNQTLQTICLQLKRAYELDIKTSKVILNRLNVMEDFLFTALLI